MPTLSLDCLTLTDSSPIELIEAAAAADFDLVSLWVNSPSAFPRMQMTSSLERDCVRLLQDTGIGVHLLEVTDLSGEAAIRAYRPALERGARLGGKAASAYHATNPDRSHVADLLALFAEIAGEFGLEVVLEPVAMARTRTLAEAEALIRNSGANAGIVFDTLHLIRSGGGPAELAAIDPALIRYVQLNDGLLRLPPDDWRDEAMSERLYLGDGEFPLAAILDILPPDIPWGIETPSIRRTSAGMDANMQAGAAMASLRKALAERKRPSGEDNR